MVNENFLKKKIAKELIELGFKTYIDKDGNELPKFRGEKKLGSLKKPDLIVFFDNEKDSHYISSPFGIELKDNVSFGASVNQPIMQMSQYKEEPKYLIEGKRYGLKTILLGTRSSVENNTIYWGSKLFPKTQREDAKYGIEWAITRQLFSLSMGKGEKKLFFGLFKKDDIGFYIQFPNFIYRLVSGGKIQCIPVI